MNSRGHNLITNNNILLGKVTKEDFFSGTNIQQIDRQLEICSGSVLLMCCRAFHGLMLVTLTGMTLKISGFKEPMKRNWCCQSALGLSEISLCTVCMHLEESICKKESVDKKFYCFRRGKRGKRLRKELRRRSFCLTRG